MNKAILMGRLTAEPELKSTGNGISVCTFTVAVDRRFKNQNGDRETDFIPVVTWRQTADFVSKYFRKGQRIAVVGSIQVRSWQDKDNQRRYTTEVVADEVHFADSKSGSGSGSDNRSTSGNQNSYSGSNSQQPAKSFENFGQPTEGFFESPDDETMLPFDL